MKKIIAMGAAVALAASMFAAEPAANVSVAEFTGSASVEWGVNLDTKKTGFANDTSASFKGKLFDAGDKSTSADGDVWAELKIKIDDKDGHGAAGYNNGVFAGNSASVDTAKFHVGDFYIGIQSGDTQVGELDLTTAIASAGFWMNPGRWLTAVGTNYTKGIVAGYGNNDFEVNVDFRSNDHYDNKYAVAGEAKLKDSNSLVNGLEVKAGGSYAIDSKDYAYAASLAYKLSIVDNFYIKPQVGMTDTKADDDLLIAGTLLFGWGATNGYGSVGLPYFDDNYARGMTPGVSVTAKRLMADTGATVINPAFYLGDVIPNLKAAAYAEIGLIDDFDEYALAVAGAIGYDIKADAVTITPKVGASYHNEYFENGLSDFVPARSSWTDGPKYFFDHAKDFDMVDYLQIKATVDVAGLINNTTFYAEYNSGNLLADTAVIGTVDVGAKISF